MILKWVKKTLTPNETVTQIKPFIETFIILGIFSGINFYFMKDDLGFLSIHPHPYWAIIFILALRYSLVETLGPLLLVASLYVWFFWHSESYFYFSTLRLLTDFKEPILFVLLGGLISDSTHQLVNPSVQLINPSTHQPIDQPINPSTHRFNPSTHRI